MDWQPRLAREDDIPKLEALIPISVKKLRARQYSRAQMEPALGSVFGVDRQLIRDGTYFVVERDSQIIGCGGWSKRNSLFGGDSGRSDEDALLNPECDPARIRAFFIHPGWARRGIGRCILAACESAIQTAGFHFVELVATLTGAVLRRVWLFRNRAVRNSHAGRSYFISRSDDEALRRLAYRSRPHEHPLISSTNRQIPIKSRTKRAKSGACMPEFVLERPAFCSGARLLESGILHFRRSGLRRFSRPLPNRGPLLTITIRPKSRPVRDKPRLSGNYSATVDRQLQ